MIIKSILVRSKEIKLALLFSGDVQELIESSPIPIIVDKLQDGRFYIRVVGKENIGYKTDVMPGDYVLFMPNYGYINSVSPEDYEKFYEVI